MNAARASRAVERLLVVDARSGTIEHVSANELSSYIREGSVVVLNDAATMPASIFGMRASDRAPVEVRLAGRALSNGFHAVVFGAGDWRTPTELREIISVKRGERFLLGSLEAEVADVSSTYSILEFSANGLELLRQLLALGRPVQYSYLERSVTLEEVQTSYADRPWASEMPSAGRPLTWSVILDLQRRGIEVVTLTHAAGLSSIGDESRDRDLPWAEPYEIPEATARAVMRAKAEGLAVVAVGTTVVRVLEASALEHGLVVPGLGTARLRLAADTKVKIVDDVLSGMHKPGTSHFELLSAFAPESLLARALAEAESGGYLAHEFGDATLVLGAR